MPRIFGWVGLVSYVQETKNAYTISVGKQSKVTTWDRVIDERKL
jgi:hypothetical protein